jgi:hypothetical protein
MNILHGYVLAIALGVSIGVKLMHEVGLHDLDREKLAHAQENQKHAQALRDMSDQARVTQQREIDTNQALVKRLAALDEKFATEKRNHETDNLRNHDLIAAGNRRLRLAVADFRASHPGQTNIRTTAGSMGDGAAGTAQLSPAFGAALYGIVDDADEVRAKLAYLQGYIHELQASGVVTCTGISYPMH